MNALEHYPFVLKVGRDVVDPFSNIWHAAKPLTRNTHAFEKAKFFNLRYDIFSPPNTLHFIERCIFVIWRLAFDCPDEVNEINTLIANKSKLFFFCFSFQTLLAKDTWQNCPQMVMTSSVEKIGTVRFSIRIESSNNQGLCPELNYVTCTPMRYELDHIPFLCRPSS